MSLSFRTNGNFIDFVNTDATSLNVETVLMKLHNTSRCIDWSLPEDTTRISFTIDEVKYSNIPITSIDFDGTVMNSQDDFETGITAMFTGLAQGGGSGGGVESVTYADTFDDFPEEGDASKIYGALDTGLNYKWDAEEEAYVNVDLGVVEPGTIMMVNEDGDKLVASALRDVGSHQIEVKERMLALYLDEDVNNIYISFKTKAGVEKATLTWAADPGALELGGGSDLSIRGKKVYIDTYEVMWSEDDTTFHVGTLAENLNLRVGNGDPGKDNLFIGGVPAASGTFEDANGKTITVTKGIITAITPP